MFPTGVHRCSCAQASARSVGRSPCSRRWPRSVSACRKARIDHRSHAERGIEAEPTRHLGPAATGYERRTGLPSRKRMDFEEIADRKAEQERQRQAWQARANWFDELIGQRNRQRQERETKKQERDGPGWHHQ
ncbi:MAG: MobA/MobL family protein [Betaproteobacteria bacterium]|nr:MobA/MobL family protein [Betaproteobacteria bacterium]